jgi:hypothetical protein
MKFYVSIILLFTISFASAQNFIDSSIWTAGIGSQGSFTRYGADDENIRELGENPYGQNTILWRGQTNSATGDSSQRQDGGIYTGIVPIDHTKNYRFHVWIRKEGSTAGRTYLGLHTYDDGNTRLTQTLAGTTNTNPYFWSGDLPDLGKWYLIVGYMYASDYTGTTINSAVYDGNTGAKVLTGLADYKFAPTATRMRLRTLFWDSDDLNAYQYFYAPSMYEVNEQMPSVQDVLSGATIPGGTGGGNSPWVLNGSDAFFSGGKVGINTNIPDYELTVKGKIHAEEVKIDLSVPAPDYVFKKEYDLQSLEAIERYINSNGHLPNIPSALEMETNGVELGLMEMKLLEKIEELTLYLIDLKKENIAIKAQVLELQKKQ